MKQQGLGRKDGGGRSHQTRTQRRRRWDLYRFEEEWSGRTMNERDLSSKLDWKRHGETRGWYGCDEYLRPTTLKLEEQLHRHPRIKILLGLLACQGGSTPLYLLACLVCVVDLLLQTAHPRETRNRIRAVIILVVVVGHTVGITNMGLVICHHVDRFQQNLL